MIHEKRSLKGSAIAISGTNKFSVTCNQWNKEILGNKQSLLEVMIHKPTLKEAFSSSMEEENCLVILNLSSEKFIQFSSINLIWDFISNHNNDLIEAVIESMI